MRNLVVFLEEQSAKEMLRKLLPRILPGNIAVRYIVFEGKQDLEKQLIGKLRGWLIPETSFLVLRDQDVGDCLKVKQKLVEQCTKAGKPETMVRIACHELESWYFGDLEAVGKGLGLENISRIKNQKKYRSPDSIIRPADELMRLTNGKYQKIAGSRAIGPFMEPAVNTSKSFNVFIAGLQRLMND